MLTVQAFLQQGSNTTNARMMIAAEFMKQKSTEEIAESLKSIYHGDFGIQAGNRSVSAWYADDGIHLAAGKTAQYNRNAQLISGKEVAERIGRLLQEGKFASNVELAEKIYLLYRNLSDEGKSKICFRQLH